MPNRRPSPAHWMAPALLLLALAPGCRKADPVQEIALQRARYQATLTGFVVQDQPGVEHPDVLLDVTLRGDTLAHLPGLTLDVSMAGPDGKEKAHRRVWVDTHDVGPGESQISLKLEDLPYAAGDGFWVEVRSPVPAAERGEYREFGEIGEASG